MKSPKPISVRGIDHVVIRSQHIERMITFYRDVLGCNLERHIEELGLIQLRAGTALIDLIDTDGQLGRMGGDPPGEDARNMDHLCLQVEPWDVVAISAFLKEHNVEVGDVETRYGAQGFGPSIYFKDPDGNTVELKGPPNS